MLTPPPPQSGDPAAEGPKSKRPWSKPRIRIIEVNFTSGGGFNPIPTANEDASSGVNPTSATYRVS